MGTIKSMSIGIFVTGGTFDKEYNELKGTLFFPRQPPAGDVEARAEQNRRCG